MNLNLSLNFEIEPVFQVAFLAPDGRIRVPGVGAPSHGAKTWTEWTELEAEKGLPAGYPPNLVELRNGYRHLPSVSSQQFYPQYWRRDGSLMVYRASLHKYKKQMDRRYGYDRI